MTSHARRIEQEIASLVQSTESPVSVALQAGPAGVPRPFRISATDPATMTAGAINKELDRLDEQNSQLGRQMIEAGRGYERPSEYLRMDDPLAVELRRNSDRRQALHVEIGMRYGPGHGHRLPTGGRNARFFGPRRKSA